MERRLAAVMAADVVGYSRLIRSDEAGTLAALKSLRSDLMDQKSQNIMGESSNSWVTGYSRSSRAL